MKKNILLLPLAAALIILCGCSSHTTKTGCHIEGNISLEGYKNIYLADDAGKLIDSCLINNGQFHLADTRNIERPYVATMQVMAEKDPADQLFMPVAIENGTVKVELAEYIQLSGTPLNKQVKAFLDDLQHCKDGVAAQKGITAEKVAEIFSQFYRQQILSYKGNAVGRYIYKSYGNHLNAADLEQVKAEMGN